MTTLLLAALMAQDPRAELIKKQTAAAIELLKKESANDYRRGQAALADLGRAAEPALVAVLNDEKTAAQVRALACDTLGDIRAATPEAIATLRRRLTDYEYFGTTVASRAARALGRSGEAAAVPDLIAALKASDDRNDLALRYESIAALGRLRAIAAADDIKTRVADKGKTDTNQLIASAALQALALLEAKGAVEEAAAALDNAAPDDWGPFPDWTVAQVAVWTLEQLMDPATWPGGTKSIASATTAERRAFVDKWVKWRDDRKKVIEAREKLDTLVAAIAAFKADNGKFPEKLDELYSGEKKYVENDRATWDPWLTTYGYDAPGWGAEYNLYSKGADQQRGGKGLDEDIWNHNEWQAFTTSKTKETLREIGTAIGTYKAQKGTWPPSLLALKNDNLYNGDLTDAWGNMPSYDPGEAAYTLTSYGYDGKPGGEGVDADLKHP